MRSLLFLALALLVAANPIDQFSTASPTQQLTWQSPTAAWSDSPIQPPN